MYVVDRPNVKDADSSASAFKSAIMTVRIIQSSMSESEVYHRDHAFASSFHSLCPLLVLSFHWYILNTVVHIVYIDLLWRGLSAANSPRGQFGNRSE